MRALAAGYHADKFDAIPFRQKTPDPFPRMERGRVVFDQDGVRLKTVMRRELNDIRYPIHLCGLAVDPHSHEARRAGSQSFQTGSKP